MLKFEKEKKLHKVKTLYFFMADTFVNKKNKVSNVLVNFEKKSDLVDVSGEWAHYIALDY